jgi:Icc-related predicted phosphoesterase
MREDLDRLTRDVPADRAVLLSHSPPSETRLDRAANDGKSVDHVPLDQHVGSVAVRRLIERWQPLLALHGHIHESARLTGAWRDRIGRTHLFGGAHDGMELPLVRFRLDALETATRELI